MTNSELTLQQSIIIFSNCQLFLTFNQLI